MNRRGLTILEMLVAIFIIAIAAGAVTKAFVTGIGFQQQYVRIVETRTARARLEETITRLLAGADLNGASRFLISPVPATNGVQPSAGVLGAGSSSVVFTSNAEELPARYLRGDERDFERLNDKFGPVGGVTEVAVSTTPAGDAGRKQGLFLREQRPPDGEPERGGKERLLDPMLKDIRFEFYDGTNWLMGWDTRSDQKDKLPVAARVTYILNGEEKPHSFIVRLPLAPGIVPPAASGTPNPGGQP